jgi:thiol:disulfide interchange protein DsbC
MTRPAWKWLIARTALFMLAGLFLHSPAPVLGQERPAGKDPCSSFSDAELRSIFDKLAPGGIPVLSYRKSPVEGLCEIAIGTMLNPQIVYMDYEKKFIIAGSIFDSRTMMNLSVAARQDIQDRFRVDVSKIPLENALLLGDENATTKAIVFTDPDCPFCSTLHQTLRQIVAKRKDVAFLIKLLPLPMHKDAYWKSKSILCNHSLKMLEDSFEKKEIPRSDCQIDEPDRTLRLAQSLTFNSTPTIVLPNGSVLVGAVPEDELLKRLDSQK